MSPSPVKTMSCCYPSWTRGRFISCQKTVLWWYQYSINLPGNSSSASFSTTLPNQCRFKSTTQRTSCASMSTPAVPSATCARIAIGATASDRPVDRCTVYHDVPCMSFSDFTRVWRVVCSVCNVFQSQQCHATVFIKFSPTLRAASATAGVQHCRQITGISYNSAQHCISHAHSIQQQWLDSQTHLKYVVYKEALLQYCDDTRRCAMTYCMYAVERPKT